MLRENRYLEITRDGVTENYTASPEFDMFFNIIIKLLNEDPARRGTIDDTLKALEKVFVKVL